MVVSGRDLRYYCQFDDSIQSCPDSQINSVCVIHHVLWMHDLRFHAARNMAFESAQNPTVVSKFNSLALQPGAWVHFNQLCKKISEKDL